MNISRKDIARKLHAKLDDGIDTLKTTKDHLESFHRDHEATVVMQLKSARVRLKAKKQGIRDVMIKMEKLMEAKKEETVEVVAEWKVNRHQQKLEKRAERAEAYAEACITLALYYASEVEFAILESVAARQDVSACK